jgi:hypothetical protein
VKPGLLTLKEEHRLRVFQNKVLRKIYGHKRGEITGDLGKMHKEGCQDSYSPPDIIRMMTSRRMR